jgi:hypothetical protein
MAKLFFVATRKGLFSVSRKNGSGNWSIDQVNFPGSPISAVLPDPRDGSVYAALDHGHFGCKLHRSPDGGKQWEECTAPAYPKKPENAEDIIDPFRKVVLPWDLKLIWTLECGGKDQPGTIWCGTIPGGLFKSTDTGDSWQLVEPLWRKTQEKRWTGGGYDFPGIHSICVDPKDANKIIVGVSVGGNWYSEDGGVSWECRAKGLRNEYMPADQAYEPDFQDPHRLVQCQGSPEVMWIQHHNGIFHSTDYALNWEEIHQAGPSTFGFAVAVHPHDPDTAWFVPAQKDEVRIPVAGKMVVTRTRDGGKTFDVLSKGLPQEHAYDLIYRHALAIDETGETLAMGSTTGNLWLSENGGDEWQCISSNLPPVYAVRFV